MLKDIVRRRFTKRALHTELLRALEVEIPHFETGSLVMVELFEATSQYMQKARCHGGPFLVVRRPFTSIYVIRGADGREAVVHGYKLATPGSELDAMHYNLLSDELQYHQLLAASAVGAAENRLLPTESIPTEDEAL